MEQNKNIVVYYFYSLRLGLQALHSLNSHSSFIFMYALFFEKNKTKLISFDFERVHPFGNFYFIFIFAGESVPAFFLLKKKTPFHLCFFLLRSTCQHVISNRD